MAETINLSRTQRERIYTAILSVAFLSRFLSEKSLILFYLNALFKEHYAKCVFEDIISCTIKKNKASTHSLFNTKTDRLYQTSSERKEEIVQVEIAALVNGVEVNVFINYPGGIVGYSKGDFVGNFRPEKDFSGNQSFTFQKLNAVLRNMHSHYGLSPSKAQVQLLYALNPDLLTDNLKAIEIDVDSDEELKLPIYGTYFSTENTRTNKPDGIRFFEVDALSYDLYIDGKINIPESKPIDDEFTEKVLSRLQPRTLGHYHNPMLKQMLKEE